MDIEARLTAKGLQEHFPMCCWPPSLAVRELATKAKEAKKKGVSNPFIFVDLRKYCTFMFMRNVSAVFVWQVSTTALHRCGAGVA